MTNAMIEDIEITEDDLASYNEKGFWLSPKIFNDDLIGRLREEYDRIFREDYDFDCFPWLRPKSFEIESNRIRQFNNGWWINEVVREAVRTPAIGCIGAKLMGTSEVRIWHDQVLSKPGAGPDAVEYQDGNVGWHQDYAHWQCSNTSNMCTAWVALQDTDELNGAFRMVVGAHKWGLREDAHTYGEKNLDELKAKYEVDGKEWIEEPVILKAGEASFHHALTFHGSGPNLRTEPRLSLIVHMMPKDCGLRNEGTWHPCATLLGPYVKNGAPFEGPFFPRIWPMED